MRALSKPHMYAAVCSMHITCEGADRSLHKLLPD